MEEELLHEHQDVAILRLLQNAECTQDEVAQLFHVSRWYVRKLVMRGVPGRAMLNQEDLDLLQVARATGLNAVELAQVLNQLPLKQN